MKKLLLIFLTLFIVLGCSTNSTESQSQQSMQSSLAEEKIPEFQFSLAFTGSNYTTKLQQAVKRIEEKTDGNVVISIFEESLMGTDTQIIQAVKNGTISIAAASTSTFREVVPQVAITNIPACFTQYVQPYIHYKGEFYDQFNKAFQQNGFELLVQESSGYRLLTSITPITRLSQINGIRIRTLNNDYQSQLWEALGATAFRTIEWNQLYYALKEGIIDAQDNPLEVIRMGNLQEVTPYALNGPFFVTYNSIAMNKETFDSLPYEYQVILKEELQYVMEKDLERLRDTSISIGGLEVNHLSLDEVEQLKVILTPLLEEILLEVPFELSDALIIENAN